MATHWPAKPCAFEIQVRKTIQKYDMLRSGDHVLVAVSGGADSTALLLCLHRLASALRLSLTVAHLNHRIRGSEGDADEEFVRQMSAELGLSFISEAAEIKQQAAEARRNLEDFARQRRYDFLHRTALCIGAQKIAVGHTLNDQAETVLLRFLRGSGLEGLSAIHPVVDRLVIRPLLECPRNRIVEYLKWRGARYREDSTNRDLRHWRNRIRQELIPYLEKNFNPRLTQTLTREADLARETYALLDSQSNRAFEALRSQLADGISLPIKEILALHATLQKLVIRHALRECLGSLRGITARHIQGILSLCGPDHSGRRMLLPQRSIALRQFGSLLLLREEPSAGFKFSYELPVPGRCVVAEAKAEFSAICGCYGLKSESELSSARAFLNPALLPKILTIRSRLPGDRYGGPCHRKVKKMLIDNKIPVSQRSALPMVIAGNNVIWIPGFRPARAYEAQPNSDQCVILEIRYY